MPTDTTWTNSPTSKKMQGVVEKGDSGIGPPAAPTIGLNKNPLLDAISKKATIDCPFDGLGIEPSKGRGY